MGDEKRNFPRKVDVSGIAGPIWLIGYLFTLGYVHLPYAKAFLALAIWPYYLGKALGRH
jgi:hypothetical protein